MKPVQPELTYTDEMIAMCQIRVIDSFASQSDSRDCIRSSQLAIAHSRKQMQRPFVNIDS